MNSPHPVPAAAAAQTVVKATDAPSAIAQVKEEIEKLGSEAKSNEVQFVTEAKSLWGRYELYVIGVGSAAATLFASHLLKLL